MSPGDEARLTILIGDIVRRLEQDISPGFEAGLTILIGGIDSLHLFVGECRYFGIGRGSLSRRSRFLIPALSFSSFSPTMPEVD
jgi:hypothetical protein